MNDEKRARLEQALDEITSSQFDAELSVISGHNQFLRSLKNTSAVQAAGEVAKSSPEAIRQVCLVLENILETKPDPRHQHPGDTAMTALTLLLSQSDPGQATKFAKLIAVTPMTANSRKLALAIIDAQVRDDEADHIIRQFLDHAKRFQELTHQAIGAHTIERLLKLRENERVRGYRCKEELTVQFDGTEVTVLADSQGQTSLKLQGTDQEPEQGTLDHRTEQALQVYVSILGYRDWQEWPGIPQEGSPVDVDIPLSETRFKLKLSDDTRQPETGNYDVLQWDPAENGWKTTEFRNLQVEDLAEILTGLGAVRPQLPF